MPPITGLNVLTAIADFDASLLDPNTAPVVLAHRNFDPMDVVEAYSCYLNYSWAETIKAKIQEGFVAVHIQTEWNGSSHASMIYLVKFKKK